MGKFINLSGNRYGFLTAIKYEGKSKWLCRCDCGEEKIIDGVSLRKGLTRSCGKCNLMRAQGPKNDLTGRRFGRLTVLKQAEPTRNKHGKNIYKWQCVCDCGRSTVVASNHLLSGHTGSCGCLHEEQMEKWKTFSVTHGRTSQKSYKTWLQIKARCYNENHIVYRYYGGKGIFLWDGWVHDPAAFCEYVEELPGYNDPKTTIDRVDFTKNYEPGNLRWITLQEQQRNKSNNVRITHNGETKIASEWAKEIGVSVSTITHRKRNHWSDDDALKPTKEMLKRMQERDLDAPTERP